MPLSSSESQAAHLLFCRITPPAQGALLLTGVSPSAEFSYTDGTDVVGYGNFTSGPPTFFLMGGGSEPAPDGHGNITGIGISADDVRVTDDNICYAIYSVSPAGSAVCPTAAQVAASGLVLQQTPSVSLELTCASACWHIQDVT